MKNSLILFLSFFILISSCKEKPSEKSTDTAETTPEVTTTKETTTTTGKVDATRIKTQLQGLWEEAEYPFRRVEFKEWTVKFTEEGMMENPKFEPYALAGTCRFDNNNIKDVTPMTLLLTLTESERCEKMVLTDTTLTLRGFATNSGSDYEIIYTKQ